MCSATITNLCDSALFCDPPIRVSGMSSLADGTVIVGVAHHDGEPKLAEF